jgi:hypothetical protein
MPTPQEIDMLWNRPESLLLWAGKMPTPQEIDVLWNRPESLFMKIVKNVSYNLK